MNLVLVAAAVADEYEPLIENELGARDITIESPPFEHPIGHEWALDTGREQTRRSPADRVRGRTGGGALIQSTTSSGTAARLRGSRYERYPFRGVSAFPLPGELGHELVHVEIVPPGSDLAVGDLERAHHR